MASNAARELGLHARVSITQLPVSTSPHSPSSRSEGSAEEAEKETARVREGLAQVFESWSNYAGFIAKSSSVVTEKEALEHFADLAEACRNPSAYVCWLCTVCQVRLEGKLVGEL